jgi:hypothetical protein
MRGLLEDEESGLQRKATAWRAWPARRGVALGVIST